ncbi:hypothetical protein BDR07DRAFT_1410651 [Suillus spraguei]|nr:hypothetical protein BDR07DRAFT_1435904 [Suillus spraguei]KAG2361105.1 hypothetical protein BDR07DRAFT_1410651 [Suillus spraguei]
MSKPSCPRASPGSKKHDCFSFEVQKCHKVKQNILRALALGFGLEYHETANSQLRLHHHPRQGFHFPLRIVCSKKRS